MFPWTQLFLADLVSRDDNEIFCAAAFKGETAPASIGIGDCRFVAAHGIVGNAGHRASRFAVFGGDKFAVAGNYFTLVPDFAFGTVEKVRDVRLIRCQFGFSEAENVGLDI